MEYKYIKFIPEDDHYKIWNTVYKKHVGEIRKERCGQWMHWQLYFTVEFMRQLVENNEPLGFTNGCIKEISRFVTTLYTRK